MTKQTLEQKIKSLEGEKLTPLDKFNLESAAGLIGCIINWESYSVLEIKI